MAEERPRAGVQPPLSNRTEQHPSLMAMYMAAGVDPSQQDEFTSGTQCRDRDPSEVFLTGPIPWGRMTPNTATHLGPALTCFQLNTPPPLMTTSPAPPKKADPFQSGPHAFREIGGPLQMPSGVRPGRMVLQLTPDEDQAVTGLLKLQYEEPKNSQVGQGGFVPIDEAPPPRNNRGWQEFRQIDAVEHYEEFLLPLPYVQDDHP
ncbi:uncharacterized protein LOC130929202 [Corythoichthys intestinalis]|uniref:uncharacterized protein LOC130929202 n=1 Tax=Corythoichthys intestinalis TaxID=161448 RepID=UPI0025A66FEE|nr:uncharacterized protein LOC130929202 [Corythoichthys intestinalis]